MMVFLQNELQNIVGNPIYAHPGGQIPKFWQKNDPKYLYYAKKTLQFEPFIMQNNNLNTFRAKHDGISSKYMAKQWG